MVVGFGEIDVSFPRTGSDTVRLDVPRSCIDSDHDGYGLGFGCKRPDCDDTDPNVPSRGLCPGFGGPDAGPQDAAPDAGPVDAGPVDAGPDAGLPGDLCGGANTCAPEEACLAQMCFKRCATNEDCGALTLGCLDTIGVCICRVPCPNGDQDCGPYECIDGCCNL